MARAMVLCAGFGSRLRPLTDELPKPLVPVGDRTILERAAAVLEGAGFRDLVVNTHHLASSFRTVSAKFGVRLHLVHEERILGTAGGVRNARRLLGPAPLVVWNGDILADPPIAEMTAAVGDAFACLAVAPRSAGEGTVGLGSAGEVVRLRGERFGDETTGADYVGVLVLSNEALGVLPDEGCLVGDVLMPALRRGARVSTRRVRGQWSDCGDARSYLDANLAFVEGLGGEPWAGPDARIGPGVSVVQSVVGAGAVVSGEGLLERCVVWPGASAAAPLADAIVTGRGVVVVPRVGSAS